MQRKVLLVVLLLVVGATLIFATGDGEKKGAGKEQVYATVVKSIAFNWFKRMEVGMNDFGKDYKVKAFMEGPSVADPLNRSP